MTKQYILIEVDDKPLTNALVKKLKSIASRGARVVGVFVTPDDGFCECGKLPSHRQGAELVKGQKYGWFIHTPCKKPRKLAADYPVNLLESRLPVRQRRFFLTVHGDH